MKMIEFLKSFPWRIAWVWNGPWGYCHLGENVGHVELTSYSPGQDGRYYHDLVVEVTNPTHGTITKRTFRIKDFTERSDGRDPKVLAKHDGTVVWEWDRPPLSCHHLVDSIEEYVRSFTA